MPKRNRNLGTKSRGRGSKKGRGHGRGKHYDPYLHIQDVPSKGRVTRIQSWTTGRQHHCLSKLEWLFFWIVEWSETVIDIREQYPLNLDETLAIANSLGISHPIARKTKKPVPITTDFLITIRTPNGPVDQARTVKYIKDLPSKRVMEKFEIDRVYWEHRGVDWGIVTENDIDLTYATNIEIVHYYYNANKLQPLTSASILQIAAALTPGVIEADLPLKNLVNDCDALFELPAGTSLKVVLHLIANRKWLVDMSKPLQTHKPLLLLSPRNISQ